MFASAICPFSSAPASSAFSEFFTLKAIYQQSQPVWWQASYHDPRRWRTIRIWSYIDTNPTFVVILSALLWKERITKRKLAALVLAFLGCCFVAGILNGALTP